MTDNPQDGQHAFPNLIGNGTSSEPYHFNFQRGDCGHSMIFGPTRAGKSADYSALALTDAEAVKVKSHQGK